MRASSQLRMELESGVVIVGTTSWVGIFPASLSEVLSSHTYWNCPSGITFLSGPIMRSFPSTHSSLQGCHPIAVQMGVVWWCWSLRCWIETENYISLNLRNILHFRKICSPESWSLPRKLLIPLRRNIVWREVEVDKCIDAYFIPHISISKAQLTTKSSFATCGVSSLHNIVFSLQCYFT